MLDKEKALKWLDDKWPRHQRKCEICGANQWSLLPDLTTSMIFNPRGINIGGNSYPQLTVVCNNCGNFKGFSAVIAQLLTKEERENG